MRVNLGRLEEKFAVDFGGRFLWRLTHELTRVHTRLDLNANGRDGDDKELSEVKAKEIDVIKKFCIFLAPHTSIFICISQRADKTAHVPTRLTARQFQQSQQSQQS